MQKITPFLWFDSEAEEAANFYVSIFKNSKIKGVTHYGDAGPGPKGSVMTVVMELDGQEFIALNGGPRFKFNMATSFVVNCDTQEEIDRMWEGLSAGGQTLPCGWLTDRYGLSWQITPSVLPRLMLGQSQTKIDRVMAEVMTMSKFDIARLQQAYDAA